MSSAMVTSNEVPWTCFMKVIWPVSCALNDRTILKDWERMRTTPSELPKKILSDPVATHSMLPGYEDINHCPCIKMSCSYF